MPYKPAHILTHDEVKSILQEAWNLGNPTLNTRSISDFKIKDFEVLENVLCEFFKKSPQFALEVPSAGALLKLLHKGDTKRNKSVALVSFYVLLKKDLLTNEEKNKLGSAIYGKNIFSDYTNRVKVLTKIKDYQTSTSPTHPEPENFEKKGANSIKIGISLFFLILVAGLIATKVWSYGKINGEEVKWEIINKQNINNQDIRISIEYDLSHISYSDAYLDFGDGETLQLQNNKGVISHSYRIPKIETLSLIVDGRKYIKSLILPSQGWFAHANNTFIQKSSFIKDNRIHLLENEETSPILKEEEFYVTYKKSLDFDIDIDDMIFEAKVKNPRAEGGINCFDVSFDLSGIHNDTISYVSFNLLKPDCTSWAKLRIGEVKLHSGNHNMGLSGLSLDNWKIVRCEINNKTLKIYADDQQLYSVPYKMPLGKLKQVQILFKGNGSIDYFNLSSNDRKKSYSYGFK